MGALCSHAIFLIICESNAGRAPVYMDPKPNTAAPRWSVAGVRRALPEDARGERLHHFNFSPGAGPFGRSIRKCRRVNHRNRLSPLHFQAKETATLSDRIYTIMAVALLQTLGLFHQHPEQRSTAMTYHSMLVSVSLPVTTRLGYANTPFR